MPALRPFRGLRYVPAVAGPLELQIAEPYDKVSPAMRRAYLARSPYNVVRLSLPEDERGDGDPYRQAAERFRGWIDRGVLRREEQPAIYLYEQRFRLGAATHVRRALFAAVEADAYAEGKVKPHERTYRVYKEERLRLLEALRAELGFVFLLYEDRERRIAELLTQATAAASPHMQLRGPDGIEHTVYRIACARTCAAVCEAFSGRTCVIADGHHRYETAVAFRRRHEEAGQTRPAYAYRLCALVEVSDPGLVVLATHRVLERPDLDSLLHQSAALLEAQPLTGPVEAEALERALGALGEAGPGAFIATDGSRAYALRLREGIDLDRALAELVAPARRLDVAILHTLVLERTLGIRTGDDGVKPWYTRTAAEALERLDDRYRLAILLRPTPARAVIEVAHAGGTMPQKSTDFYPKFPSGLVIYDLEEGDGDASA